LEQIAVPDNLREGFLRASLGKTHKADVIAFRANLEAELSAMHDEILSGASAVGRFTAFTIWEPKQRRIHAPCFRERVLHHALVGACEMDFERWLIDDTYACRRGKGREAALRRAEGYARRHRWFLKWDVAKYFDSIPHAVLLAAIRQRFYDTRVAELWVRIVSAYETAPGRGLPIGALTSQHLANFYLGSVDRLAKETLRLPGYVRYMDDMAAWADDKGSLLAAKQTIEQYLRTALGLELKANWQLQPTRSGMDFLGYRVRPTGSSLNRSSRRRFVRRWRWIEAALATGGIEERVAQRRVMAMAAFARAAQSDGLLHNLFSGTGHRARTASTAAAVGTTPRPIVAPPTATGTRRATATTTSASASPSAHAIGPEGPTD